MQKSTNSITVLYRENGTCRKWMSAADHDTKALAKDVNAPLLEYLAGYIGEVDTDCVEYFRVGALAQMRSEQR